MNNESRASVTIHAGPITATENRAGAAGRQVKLSGSSFIYFTAEVAKQWIETLTPIANEKSN